MIAYAQNYGTILTWFDKPEIAAAVAGALPGAFAIASPQGKDANDSAARGAAGRPAEHSTAARVRGQVQRERLLWDLWDAADGVHRFAERSQGNGIGRRLGNRFAQLADGFVELAATLMAEP